MYLSVMKNRSTLAVNKITMAITRIYVTFCLYKAMRPFLPDGSSQRFLRNNGLLYERTLFAFDSNHASQTLERM
jgi:hypothetical protein